MDSAFFMQNKANSGRWNSCHPQSENETALPRFLGCVRAATDFTRSQRSGSEHDPAHSCLILEFFKVSS